MTAGELVINIVMKGGEKAKASFEDLGKGLKKVQSSSLEAKAALVGVIYAFDRLISMAGAQGAALASFANLTGQSTESLQRWKLAFQHTGGAAEEMEGSVKSLYSALARQNAGMGGISGFGFINNQMNMDQNRVRNNDVFYVMDQLRKFANTQKGKTGLGTEQLRSFGLSDNVIAGLRNKDFSPDSVSKGLIIGDKEQERLNRMNMSLNDFWTSLKRFGTQQTEIFGPDVVKNLNGALHTIEKLTIEFDKWARHHGDLAALATVFTTMATAFVIMGGPLSVITGAVGSLIWLGAQWDKHAHGDKDNVFGDKDFKNNIGERVYDALHPKDESIWGFLRSSWHADQPYAPPEGREKQIRDQMKDGTFFHPIFKGLMGGSKAQPPPQKGASINIHNYGVEDDTLANTILDSVNRQLVRGPYFQSASLTQVS